MDWTSGGSQSHLPTLHAFLNGLYHNAEKDGVIPPADRVHERIRYQLIAFSEKLLMPTTCVPPIHSTALAGTPDWWVAFKHTIMKIRADVGEHGLDTVMLIAELDVNVAMNATPSQMDTAIALIQRMKHAFEVPQLLHDTVLASAMRTAPLNLNVVMVNAFLHLRLWCSETEQIREFDHLFRHMTESQALVEAHEVTEVFIRLIITIERYLEPESLDVADSDCCSNSTSSDDDVVPRAESPKLTPLAGETFRFGDAYPPRM
eukprot:553406-Pleurochrysis_carterae.AAC.1